MKVWMVQSSQNWEFASTKPPLLKSAIPSLFMCTYFPHVSSTTYLQCHSSSLLLVLLPVDFVCFPVFFKWNVSPCSRKLPCVEFACFPFVHTDFLGCLCPDFRSVSGDCLLRVIFFLLRCQPCEDFSLAFRPSQHRKASECILSLEPFISQAHSNAPLQLDGAENARPLHHPFPTKQAVALLSVCSWWNTWCSGNLSAQIPF